MMSALLKSLFALEDQLAHLGICLAAVGDAYSSQRLVVHAHRDRVQPPQHTHAVLTVQPAHHLHSQCEPLRPLQLPQAVAGEPCQAPGTVEFALLKRE